MRLSSSLLSAAGLALVGAVVSVGAVTARFSSRSALVLGMDQEKSPVLSGFWDPEVDGATSFQWTKARADVILPDLNRRTFWQCAIRFRGARPAGVAEPTVDVAVDGVTILSVSATNEFQDAAVTIPASPRPGTRVTIASAPTFHAPPDPREFGVQVDSVECHPDPAPFALPPFSALRGAAVAGAAWGAAFGLAGASAGLSIPMTVAVTATQSLPLMAGVAPYSGFSQRAEWLSLWICSAMVLTIAALDRRARWQLSAAARFVVLFSGAVLYVKLLGLLHPAKIAQDAVFHAHNLEKLLDGRVFFTQPMPSGVQFPYAVALYVAAAPWVAFTHSTPDRVALLRIIVCAADLVAGACLYCMIVRNWGDRVAGIAAVVLYQFLPLSYGMQGNANLTYAFGQSISVIAIALATNWSLQRRRWPQVGVLAVVIAVAMLSHVSVLASMVSTLAALVVLYWISAVPLRPQARSILVATAVAAALAVGLFYGRWDHFGAAYTSAARTTGTAEAAAAPVPTPAVQRIEASFRPLLGLEQIVDDLGWPIIVLGCAGAWRIWRMRRRDRLVLALVAWPIGFSVWFAVGVFGPVKPEFVRYTLEFISRADHVSSPAVLIAAAAAFSWAWSQDMAKRSAAVGLMGWAIVTSVTFWLAWFQ